jgi:hypothetical protein
MVTIFCLAGTTDKQTFKKLHTARVLYVSKLMLTPNNSGSKHFSKQKSYQMICQNHAV